jgi:preprotein translocase subunit SecD
MEKKQIKGSIELAVGVFLYVLGFIVLVPSAVLWQHHILTLACAVSICAGAALMLFGIADCSL